MRSVAAAGVISQQRRTASNKTPLIPGMPHPKSKTQRKATPAITKAVSKAVSDASKDGRPLALRVLEDINWSGDPPIWLPHAIAVLEIYRQSIEKLHSGEAKAALLADKAADTVEQWYTQPTVRKAIDTSRRKRTVGSDLSRLPQSI
jgi:hypothetical protein